MLVNVVGRTGSGKSLYQAYKIYTECTRIMRNGKNPPLLFRLPVFNWLLSGYYSYYDKVGMNSEFDDGRGNTCKFDLLTRKWVGTGCIMGVTDIPDVYNERNMLIHLDEAGTKFNNRDWNNMPDGYVDFLTTHRHNVTDFYKRFDMFLYTQHADLLEISLGRIAVMIYLIRPLFPYPKDPTRPRWYNKLPAIRIWTYEKHELLQGKPFQELDVNGMPIPISKEHSLEKLDFWTWFYFGKKYRQSYNTHDIVHRLIRNKGK